MATNPSEAVFAPDARVETRFCSFSSCAGRWKIHRIHVKLTLLNFGVEDEMYFKNYTQRSARASGV